MEDITKVCVDCGKEFVWTVGEQEFYAAKGLTNEPKRCKECAKARRQQKNSNNNFPREN